jgi:hypothetical protein
VNYKFCKRQRRVTYGYFSLKFKLALLVLVNTSLIFQELSISVFLQEDFEVLSDELEKVWLSSLLFCINLSVSPHLLIGILFTKNSNLFIVHSLFALVHFYSRFHTKTSPLNSHELRKSASMTLPIGLESDSRKCGKNLRRHFTICF